APKAHLGSAVINWAPYYTKVVQDALDGKVENGQNFWWGVKEGAMDLVKISDDVPQNIKDKVAEVRQGLKDGTFQIWKGPLKDNTGKELLADGQVADMPFITSIKFYVNGVEGTVPGTGK
ncbi:BMP family ABC transporter substrate-binding protein, partial [Comamonas aquatica]|nr:BMP family ABC transporter substrate-binding protein [Comamonas aquatica]